MILFGDRFERFSDHICPLECGHSYKNSSFRQFALHQRRGYQFTPWSPKVRSNIPEHLGGAGRSMSVQLLFDWLVLRPAEALSGFAIVPISLMPIVAAIFGWRWVVRVADGRNVS